MHEKSFHLGLAMAGAATGGAFSAGVLDFLWLALSEWDAAKKRGDPSVPPWSVGISDITGASAGGLTAFIAASTANAEYVPNPSGMPLPGHSIRDSPFHSAWVRLVTAERLFDTSDFDALSPENRKVSSVLSSTFMADTAKMVLPAPTKPRFDWILPNMMLTLTATNLRGVPYSLGGFASSDPKCSKFGMKRHADYVRFHFNLPGDDELEYVPPDSYKIPLQDDRSTEPWRRGVTAARATAAYPIGFPSVKIEVPRQNYYTRREGPPSWAEEAKDGNESYAALDGGILNNEPFALLENQMKERHGQTLKDDPGDAWGSILLIDPFPDRAAVDDSFIDGDTPIGQVFSSLYSIVRGDAMFKDNDILHALDKKRLDRFMIVPNRMPKDWQTFYLATGGLGGFGGILDGKMRQHDYLLGRKNCQQFLRDVFRMPVDAAKKNKIFNEHVEFLTGDSVAIIPLVGKAAEDVEDPEWPTYTKDEAWQITCNVAKAMEPRFNLIVDIMLENSGIVNSSSWNPLWIGTNSVVRLVKWPLMGYLMGKVRSKLYEAMKCFVPP